MTIETKFNVNDTIWWVKDNYEKVKGKVIGFIINQGSKRINTPNPSNKPLVHSGEYENSTCSIYYTVVMDGITYTPIYETHAFHTKEELIQHITEHINK